MAELTEPEVQELGERGFFCRSGLAPDLCAEAGRLAASMARDDQLDRAGVGEKRRFRREDRVRGDRITWIDQTNAVGPLEGLVETFEMLMDELNRKAWLGLRHFDVQLAHYAAPNRGYDRHLDAFPGRDNRRVTATLYLNEDWSAADGGQMRLFVGEKPVDLLPEAGRMVVFRSTQVEHRVLPTERDRAALTAWYRGSPVH